MSPGKRVSLNMSAMLSHWQGTAHEKLGLAPNKRIALRAQQLGPLVNNVSCSGISERHIFIVDITNFLRI